MTKEEYLEKLENYKERKKQLDEKLDLYRTEYIESNKPCNIGDNVNITLNSGRKVSGEVLSFDILKELTVSITSYKEESTVKYITVPHKDVKLI